MRATVLALLVISRGSGHLVVGRVRISRISGHHGDVSGRPRADLMLQAQGIAGWHGQHPTNLRAAMLWPRSLPGEEVNMVFKSRLRSAGTEGVKFPAALGSLYDPEEENASDEGAVEDNAYGDDDDDDEDYDPFIGVGAGFEATPPLSEESWTFAAAEEASEMIDSVEHEGIGAGVDLELLDMPETYKDDEEDDAGVERLDVSDFLGAGTLGVAGGGVEERVSYTNAGRGVGVELGPDKVNLSKLDVGARNLDVDKEDSDRSLHPMRTEEAAVEFGLPQAEVGDIGDAPAGYTGSFGHGSGESVEPTSSDPGEVVEQRGGSGGVGDLEGLSPDEVERRLISAGILHADGAEIDMEEYNSMGGSGAYNEIEVSDGDEACRILEKRLGFDEEGVDYLRSKYPPLRGELWYRREPTSGSKTGKKFLDVFFLEETLPELLDLLLGEEGENGGQGGVGLTADQVRDMLTTTPSLLGVEASDAHDVVDYLRSGLGLRGKGQVASALAGCPPMLMYHTWDNLRKKVSYYCESLAWTNDDVAAMLPVFPNLLSIKMENDVIEVIDYLRTEIGLQPLMVSKMIREYPEILDVRPKRLKAFVKYLWKVLEIPRSGVAVILSQYPRACCLEAEANLAPLRHFFERELFVEDTSRIGHLVYKFPRLLFQDVETQLVPRAEEFRKAMGLEGLQPLPPRVRQRPKSGNNRDDYDVRRGGGGGRYGDNRASRTRRGRGDGRGSGRPRFPNSGGRFGGRSGGGGRGLRSSGGAGRGRNANIDFAGTGGGAGDRLLGGRSGRGGSSEGGRGGGGYRGRGHGGGYVE